MYDKMTCLRTNKTHSTTRGADLLSDLVSALSMLFKCLQLLDFEKRIAVYFQSNSNMQKGNWGNNLSQGNKWNNDRMIDRDAFFVILATLHSF